MDVNIFISAQLRQGPAVQFRMFFIHLAGRLTVLALALLAFQK